MKNLTIPLTVVAVATLGACAGHREVRTAAVEPTVTVVSVDTTATAVPARAGTGKVVYVVDPTGPIDGISTQQLTLKMDDGSMQVVEQRGQQIAMGAHVRIRSDSRIASLN